MRIILASLILSVLYTGAALAQIYVANQGSNTVSVLSDNPTVTVDVGGSPTALAVTPDGDFVYVTKSEGTVSVIQTSDNTVTDTVDVGVAPEGITVGPEGTNIYVANSGSNTVNIMCVEDPMCGLVTIDVGETPVGIASSQNSTLNLGLIYVANQGSNTITIINKPFNEIEATLDVAASPTGIAATPNGNFIYLTHFNSSMGGRIDFGTTNGEGWSDESLFPTGDKPIAVAIAPSVGLEDPEPMGQSSGRKNSCSLAAPGASPSFPLYLLIPAFILINRFWRRRTN